MEGIIFTVVLSLTTLSVLYFTLSLLRKSTSGTIDESGKVLALLFLMVTIWGVTSIVNSIIQNYYIVDIFTRLSYVSGVLLVIFFYKFILTLDDPQKRSLIVVKILGVLLVLLTLFTDRIVAGVEFVPSAGSQPVIGDQFYLYLLYLLPIILASLARIFITLRDTTGENILRLKYLLAGMFLSGTLLIVFGIILPLLGFDALIPYTFLAILPTVVMATYSFINKKIYDIDFILGKFILSTIYIVLIFLIYNGVTYFHTKVWGSPFNMPAYVSGFAIAVLFVVVSQYSTKSISKFISNRFIYKEYDPITIMSEMRKELAGVVKTRSILQIAEKYIQRVVPISGAVLLMDDEGIKITKDNGDILTDEEIKDYTYIYNLIDKSKSFYLSDELPLKKKSISALIIIRQGMVILGSLQGDAVYTLNKIALIENIVEYLSFSLIRASLYEKMADFNQTLQQKVEKATEELRKQKNQLEETLRKERDMMDILGHELRTPLAVIRNGLAIAKMNLGKDPEKVEEWLEKSKEALMNEINIVDTVLASSRIAGERVEVRLEEVDLNKVIQKVFSDFETKARSKGLYLKYEPAEKSKVYADKGKVRQIFTNLVSNAVKYTNEGGLKVRVYEKEGRICTEFKDTGVGISKEDLANLGKKFYRAKQYLNDDDKEAKLVRPGGTGLGLYISINLVRMMGGELRFDSELGKGSIFTVCLPEYVGQEVHTEEGGQKEVEKVKEKSKDAFERLGLKK